MTSARSPISFQSLEVLSKRASCSGRNRLHPDHWRGRDVYLPRHLAPLRVRLDAAHQYQRLRRMACSAIASSITAISSTCVATAFACGIARTSHAWSNRLDHVRNPRPAHVGLSGRLGDRSRLGPSRV